MLVIAQLQLNAKQYTDALATVAPVQKVTPADAPTLFRIMAYAQMGNSDSDEAGKSAQRWKDTAKDDGDRQNAEKLITYLDSARAVKQAAADRAAARQAAADRNAAQLNRPAIDGSDTAIAQPVLSTARPVAGSPDQKAFVARAFVEFNCAKKQPRFVLKTAQGNVSFLLDDPKGVFIRGREKRNYRLKLRRSEGSGCCVDRV